MIYLDNAATTRPFDAVIEAMAQSMRENYFNPSSAYAPAMKAAEALRGAREAVLSALHAKGYSLLFTSGATESNNTAIFGALRKPLDIVTTAGEHPSVLFLKNKAESLGHAFQAAPIGRDGRVDLDALAALLHEKTGLISVQWVNNETGAVQPLAEIARLRDEICPDALLHVDGVQGFLRVPLRLQNSGIDLFSLSGHKIHAPKGIGALLFSNRVRLQPLLIGGGQESDLRSGTENVPGIVGLGEAVRQFAAHPDWPDEIRAKKLYILKVLRDAIPGLLVNGSAPEEAAPHILNISVPGVRGEVLLHALEAENVLVSTGSACSAHKKGSHVLAAMQLSAEAREGAVRISLSPLTTREELAEAATKIMACAQALLPFRRR